ncbi:winged helix-turn-helix transcriptional regulator [Nocardioides hankookensis]
MSLTEREQEIVALLRRDPLIGSAALARELGTTRAAVNVHLSNLGKKGVILGRGYVLSEQRYVVVVGGANMDVKARSRRSVVAATSNPGTAAMSAGGVGRNIAENLARLGTRPGVAVERRDLPGDWPPGEFDLVVLSEVGYFLSPRDLDHLVARIDAALAPDGDLVLCHWRHPIVGWPLDGPTVHDRVRSRLSRPEVGTYRERDFELAVFSRAPLPEAGA